MGWVSKRQQDRDHNGLRNVCAADGRPGTKADPLGKSTDGSRIHKSHLNTPGNGFYGQEQED